jgi:hypothetical protein
MSDPATEVAFESPFKKVILPSPITIDRPRVFVNPPTIHIGSGDSKLRTIVWVNETGGDVLIWLPNAHHYLKGEAEDFLTLKTIDAGKMLPLEVRPDCVDGYYHYNVYCKAIDGYAEGNSEPGASCP